MSIGPRLARIEEPAANRRWFAVATVLLVFAGIAFSLSRTRGKSTDFQDLDFGAIYRGSTAVRAGETLYVVDEFGPLGSYVYGPALAFAFQPLTHLDYIWACRIWTVFNWGLAVACVAMSASLAFGPRWTWPAIALTVIPTASYFWSGIRVGQLGVLMVASCIAWAWLTRNGRSFSGGLCLAWAAGLKLAPGFLVPYLVLRRDWRGLAGVAVGGLAIFLLPACSVGLDGSLQLHRDWAAHCRNTQVVEQTYRPENQSLLGELARLPAISDGHNLINPDGLDSLGKAYPWIMLAVAAATYGAIAWRMFRRTGRADPRIETLNIALLLAVMTLIHPRAWTCNFIVLAVPCTVLARVATERAPGYRAALGALVLLTVVCAVPKVGPGAEWSLWRWVLQGKDFWAAFVAVGCCFWCQSRAAAVPSLRVRSMAA